MQDVDDLLEGLLGLVLTGHVQEGDAGLFLHVDLGVGLAQVAHAADAALAAHAPEQDPEQAHHNEDGQHIGQEQVEQVQRAVHRLRIVGLAVLIVQVLVQQVIQTIVREAVRANGHILDRLTGVLLAGGDERLHQLLSLAAGVGLFTLGQLHLHALLQGKGDLTAFNQYSLNLVLHQPLPKGVVRDRDGVGVLIGGHAAPEQQRQEQGPQDNAHQSERVAPVVAAASSVGIVVVSFVWLQGRIPPSNLQNRNSMDPGTGKSLCRRVFAGGSKSFIL